MDDEIKEYKFLLEQFHQNLCKMEAPCFSYGEEIL